MIERLLAIKGPLLEEQGWDNLATSEWKTIGYIRDLLKPFAQYTDYTTISCVIPIIMELNIHLEEMKKIPEVSWAANTLLVELRHRFRKFTAPGDAEHDPTFLASAMVDPRFRVLLNPTQQDSAKSELLTYLKDHSESESSGTSSPRSPTTQQEEPPPKRFCHLTKILRQKRHEDLSKKEEPR